MSCVFTWSDAGAHSPLVIPKPNHVTRPLLAISEINDTGFIMCVRNELSHPSLTSVLLSTWVVSTGFYQLTNSLQTHTPEWAVCYLVSKHHTRTGLRHTLLSAWQRSVCDVRLLPDKSRSGHSTKWELISSPVGAEGRTAVICAQCEICAFLCFYVHF